MIIKLYLWENLGVKEFYLFSLKYFKMTLDKVLEIANECVYNDNIPVEGLTLKYSR